MEPRLIVAVAMLVGGSILDLQTRRVGNRYWIPFIVAAGFFMWGEPPSMQQLFGVAGAIVAAYLFWRVGLFGGADGKGLMVVALLTPQLPDLLAGRTLVAIDALVNASLFMVAFPLIFLAFNALRGDLKLPVALLGFRMNLDVARSKFMWPMQEARDGIVKMRYFNKPGSDVGGTFAGLARAGVQKPWVTPKIPFMVPLTAGLIMAGVKGNLMLIAMARLLG